jgi:hypothetical protein
MKRAERSYRHNSPVMLLSNDTCSDISFRPIVLAPYNNSFISTGNKVRP